MGVRLKKLGSYVRPWIEKNLATIEREWRAFHKPSQDTALSWETFRNDPCGGGLQEEDHRAGGRTEQSNVRNRPGLSRNCVTGRTSTNRPSSSTTLPRPSGTMFSSSRSAAEPRVVSCHITPAGHKKNEGVVVAVCFLLTSAVSRSKFLSNFAKELF